MKKFAVTQVLFIVVLLLLLCVLKIVRRHDEMSRSTNDAVQVETTREQRPVVEKRVPPELVRQGTDDWTRHWEAMRNQ